jgi:hypothetical protein
MDGRVRVDALASLVNIKNDTVVKKEDSIICLIASKNDVTCRESGTAE